MSSNAARMEMASKRTLAAADDRMDYENLLRGKGFLLPQNIVSQFDS
jgi:hypothetical protein